MRPKRETVQDRQVKKGIITVSVCAYAYGDEKFPSKMQTVHIYTQMSLHDVNYDFKFFNCPIDLKDKFVLPNVLTDQVIFPSWHFYISNLQEQFRVDMCV